jgi:hypothetical protein
MSLTAQNRSRKGRVSRVDPASDRLLNMAEVGHRWSTTPHVARERLEKHGVKLVRFSERSCEVWLSDLEALEQKFTN